MNLKDILAISGYGGLFKTVAKTRNGMIVESLTDGKRMPVNATAKISSLEDIAIYTEAEEVPLKQVFTTIYEKPEGFSAFNSKTNSEQLKTLFSSILPNYDKNRVYVSDMKRVFIWYNQLFEKGFITQEEEKEETKVEEQ